jgi:hypothetical protein
MQRSPVRALRPAAAPQRSHLTSSLVLRAMVRRAAPRPAGEQRGAAEKKRENRAARGPAPPSWSQELRRRGPQAEDDEQGKGRRLDCGGTISLADGRKEGGRQSVGRGAEGLDGRLPGVCACKLHHRLPPTAPDRGHGRRIWISTRGNSRVSQRGVDVGGSPERASSSRSSRPAQGGAGAPAMGAE